MPDINLRWHKQAVAGWSVRQMGGWALAPQRKAANICPPPWQTIAPAISLKYKTFIKRVSWNFSSAQDNMSSTRKLDLLENGQRSPFSEIGGRGWLTVLAFWLLGGGPSENVSRFFVGWKVWCWHLSFNGCHSTASIPVLIEHSNIKWEQPHSILSRALESRWWILQGIGAGCLCSAQCLVCTVHKVQCTALCTLLAVCALQCTYCSTAPRVSMQCEINELLTQMPPTQARIQCLWLWEREAPH